MMRNKVLSRRGMLKAGIIGGSSVVLTGCDQFDFLRDRENPLREAMVGINELTQNAQRLVQNRHALAKEFAPSEIRQGQKPNGSTRPRTSDYINLENKDFADYQLKVFGAVKREMRFSLADLRNMPSRTQITRHDCVEGWSAIAKWHGVPLESILDQTGLLEDARYVVFHCFDAPTNSLSGPELYYESIDLIDAYHPQTILAYGLNDRALPTENGAPLRLRVERQLGYKMAKYIKSIEVVSHFSAMFGGKGGYWEDRGYEWYSGI